MYKCSNYLKIIERENDYALFNSLFGGLLIVNNNVIDLLKKFKKPCSLEDILEYKDKKKTDRVIKILKDRYFIVKDYVDEYKIVQKEKKRRLGCLNKGEFIDSIQLIVSNTCNFNCEYCFMKSIYSSKERFKLQKSKDNQLMSFEIASKSIDTLINLAKNNNIMYITVEFFGGEPLCNFPLMQQIFDTYKNGLSKGVCILYSMVTNGSLIDDKIAKTLAKNGVHVALSFDSPSIDKRTGQAEAFNKMIQSKVDLLNKYGATIIINSALTKQNIDAFDVNLLFDFLNKNNIKKLVVTHELDINYYEDKKNIDKLVNKTIEILDYARKYDINVNSTWADIFNQINRDAPINLIRGSKACAGCSSKLSIEPNGETFACKSTSAHFGNIKCIDSILASHNYKSSVSRGYDNCAKCRGCMLEGFCSGLCIGSIEKKYNTIFAIEEKACRIFKDITINFIKNIKVNTDYCYLTE
ncbi:4Fe-4S cluster-binding domain-containing protein [Clostridiaceae bacterium M8S5]|nr:4Fe-4S cluster-binding domain-containing protein [Clostridiaceae bacterium M8S5]